MSGSSPEDSNRRRKKVAQIAQAYRAAHEVVSGAMSLGLMVLAGFWLDRRYGLSPVFTICGSLLGFVVAGISFYQLVQRLDQESAKKKQKPADDREARSK